MGVSNNADHDLNQFGLVIKAFVDVTEFHALKPELLRLVIARSLSRKQQNLKTMAPPSSAYLRWCRCGYLLLSVSAPWEL